MREARPKGLVKIYYGIKSGQIKSPWGLGLKFFV